MRPRRRWTQHLSRAPMELVTRLSNDKVKPDATEKLVIVYAKAKYDNLSNKLLNQLREALNG